MEINEPSETTEWQNIFSGVNYTLETLFSLYYPEDLQKLHEKEEIIGDFLYNEATIKGAFVYKAVYLKRLRHSGQL